MTNSLGVNIAVEGELDEAVLTKVLTSVGIGVVNVYGKRGKNNLKENVPRYNQAAQHGRWVVLVDLNNDAECPPPFINSWLPARNKNLQLRVAVRAVEAWLLAERDEIARFLAVSKQRIPLYPENEDRAEKNFNKYRAPLQKQSDPYRHCPSRAEVQPFRGQDIPLG